MADIDIRSNSGGLTRADAMMEPRLRRITGDDLRDALLLGWQDFKAKPSHLVFLALIYPIAGVVLSQLSVSYNIFPLLFPLLAGFALLGPFAAIGLYEISRRREKGISSAWGHAFGVLRSPAIGQIAVLGAMLTGLFLMWLAAAWFIYRGFFGWEPLSSLGGFLQEVLTTPRGWGLIIVGNAVGLVFAVAAFSLTVVSFPLMLDRHVDVATAVKTSILAVRENPGAMALWGLIVAGLLVLGSIPVLVGLVVVMPVLGHATWHLYRKVVEA